MTNRLAPAAPKPVSAAWQSNCFIVTFDNTIQAMFEISDDGGLLLIDEFGLRDANGRVLATYHCHRLPPYEDEQLVELDESLTRELAGQYWAQARQYVLDQYLILPRRNHQPGNPQYARIWGAMRRSFPDMTNLMSGPAAAT